MASAGMNGQGKQLWFTQAQFPRWSWLVQSSRGMNTPDTWDRLLSTSLHLYQVISVGYNNLLQPCRTRASWQKWVWYWEPFMGEGDKRNRNIHYPIGWGSRQAEAKLISNLCIIQHED